ncbi:hypothetical protein ES703_37673 [subsurface metagenome]
MVVNERRITGSMNEAEIIKKLKEVAGFFEVYHKKTSFEGSRTAKNGAAQKVVVDILDSGPEAGDLRYACVATSEDGKTATGNEGPSIDVVLATVHWQELDM